MTVTYHYLLDTCIRPGNYTLVETQPFGYDDGLETSLDPQPAGNQPKVGNDVFTGADGVPAAVASHCATAEPPAFVAVTTERIVKPTSLAFTRYELELAPPISVHAKRPIETASMQA